MLELLTPFLIIVASLVIATVAYHLGKMSAYNDIISTLTVLEDSIKGDKQGKSL